MMTLLLFLLGSSMIFMVLHYRAVLSSVESYLSKYSLSKISNVMVDALYISMRLRVYTISELLNYAFVLTL